MATNLDSVFYVGQAVAKRMIPRGRGKIINTCSLGSELARPTIAPYTASKGAVKMLTKAMCVEWAKFGIQVERHRPGLLQDRAERGALHRSGLRRLGRSGGRPPAAGASSRS